MLLCPLHPNDLKTCLNEKKLAFLRGEMDLVREKEKEFRQRVFKAKIDFKNKIEQRFCSGNAKQAWEGLNVMMGREQNKQSINITDCSKFVNDLNTFYGRFDVRDPKAGCGTVCDQTGSYEPIKLSEEEVGRCLFRIKPSKAPGPDGLRGRVLKSCAQQLRGVMTQLFQTLLDRCTFPNRWKKSIIIPVPKIPRAGALKDFRPVALTPLLAKCMERVVSTHLRLYVSDQLDPCQFAYRPHRGTEDAELCGKASTTSKINGLGSFY